MKHVLLLHSKAIWGARTRAVNSRNYARIDKGELFTITVMDFYHLSARHEMTIFARRNSENRYAGKNRFFTYIYRVLLTLLFDSFAYHAFSEFGPNP